MNATITLAEAIAAGYVVAGNYSAVAAEYRQHCQAQQQPFVIVRLPAKKSSTCWIEVDLIGLPYTLDGPAFVEIERILKHHHAGTIRQSNFSASRRYLESKRILTSDAGDVLAAILAVLALPTAFAPIAGYKQAALLPGMEATA